MPSVACTETSILFLKDYTSVRWTTAVDCILLIWSANPTDSFLKHVSWILLCSTYLKVSDKLIIYWDRRWSGVQECVWIKIKWTWGVIFNFFSLFFAQGVRACEPNVFLCWIGFWLLEYMKPIVISCLADENVTVLEIQRVSFNHPNFQCRL